MPQRLTTLLITAGKSKRYAKKQVLQSTDGQQNLCYIKSGYVKRYRIGNDGAINIQVIYGPGSIFPITVALKLLFKMEFHPSHEVYYYETMSDSVIYTIDNETFVEKVKGDPILYAGLLQEAGNRLEYNIQKIENISLRSSYKRVAHELLYFAKNFGEKTKEGTKIMLPLTQQDLADVLSMTRETASLCITHLRQKKLIKSGRHLTVLDTKKLEEEAFS